MGCCYLLLSRTLSTAVICSNAVLSAVGDMATWTPSPGGPRRGPVDTKCPGGILQSTGAEGAPRRRTEFLFRLMIQTGGGRETPCTHPHPPPASPSFAIASPSPPIPSFISSCCAPELLDKIEFPMAAGGKSTVGAWDDMSYRMRARAHHGFTIKYNRNPNWMTQSVVPSGVLCIALPSG
jgi:hypothetical protein